MLVARLALGETFAVQHFPAHVAHIGGVPYLLEASRVERHRRAFLRHKRRSDTADSRGSFGADAKVVKWELAKSVGFAGLVLVPCGGRGRGGIHRVSGCLL